MRSITEIKVSFAHTGKSIKVKFCPFAYVFDTLRTLCVPGSHPYWCSCVGRDSVLQ